MDIGYGYSGQARITGNGLGGLGGKGTFLKNGDLFIAYAGGGGVVEVENLIIKLEEKVEMEEVVFQD